MKTGNRHGGGFTLIELLIVISIILILAIMAVPSFSTVAKSIAWPLAYNTLSSQIAIARMEAIARQGFCGVHVQMADKDANPGLEGLQYAGIIASGSGSSSGGYFSSYSGGVLKDYAKYWSRNAEYTEDEKSSPWLGCPVVIVAGEGMDLDANGSYVSLGTVAEFTAGDLGADSECYKNTLRLEDISSAVPTHWNSLYQILPNMSLASGFVPSKLPRSMAFGHLDDRNATTGAVENFIDASGNYVASKLSDAGVADFTTFTIVFTSTGRLTTMPMGRKVVLNRRGKAFNSEPDHPRLWDYKLTNDNGDDVTSTSPDGEVGVATLTLFENDPVYFGRLSAAKRTDVLNETGLFLPINRFTGEFMDKR